MNKRINPNQLPSEKLVHIYKHKMNYERQQNAILFLKYSLKVLRNEFDFTPEMVSKFTMEFEKEIKQLDD